MIPPLNKKSTLALLILTVAAYAGNYFKLPLFFGLDFLFGSIFVLIVLRLFGLFWGTLTAIIAAVYTVILWNHPYGAVILVCEALFIGLISRRHSQNILLLDGIYWVFIGIPLVWVFYHLILHVDPTQTFLVLFKQSVNGIFNALLANLIFTYLPIHKWISRPQLKKTLSIKQTSLNLLVAFVFFPVLLLTVLDGQRVMSNITDLVKTELQSTSTDIRSDLQAWHKHRVYALQELAKIAVNSDIKLIAENATPNLLQQSTEILEKAFIDFNNLYVANTAGKIIASYPRFNKDGRDNIGLNVDDESNFQQTKAQREPLLTNIYTDEFLTNPHVGLSVPIIAKDQFRGLVYVSWDLNYISRRISSKIENKQLQITLVDRSGSIIATNQQNKTGIEKFKRPQNWEIKLINNSIYQWLPDRGKVPPVVRWKNSFYVQETLIGEKIPWKLIVSAPATPYVNYLQGIYIKDLAIMLLVAIAAMLLAELVSRKLVSPIESLADVTTNLPDKILDREAIAWPNSIVSEIDSLVSNFQIMAIALNQKFQEIKNANETLEQKVKQRTAKLIQANKKLRQEINQRRSTEEALRDSEERWQLALRGNNDGIWDWNVKTNEIFFSPRWKEMLGYADDDIQHNLDEWGRRIYPDDLGWVTKAIQDHFDKKTPFYLTEHRVLCKDGSYKWVLDRGQALWDENGKPIRMVGSHTDITERKKAEVALQESERKYRSVVDTVKEVIFQTDAADLWTFLNPAWTEITGFSVNESIGTNFLDYVHPDDRQRNFELFQPLIQRHKEYCRHEIRYLTKDDGYRCIEVFARLVVDAEDNIIGTSGTLNDITERKQTEAALIKSEELYRTLAQNYPSGAVILFDQDLRYTIADGAGLSEVGLSRELLEGKTIWESFPPETCEQIEPDYRAALSGEVRINEVPYNNHIYLVHTLPVRNNEGEIFAGMVVTQDITSLKKAEAEVRALNAELEKRVMERTAQLEAANQLKDELLVREQQARASSEASEQRFRLLTEVMPQQVWTATADGSLDYVNQRTLDYFGRTNEQMLNWGWTNFIHPEDLERCLERWSKSLATGELYEVEFRLYQAAGETYRWHIGRAFPLQNEDGQILSWFGTNTDIEDQKRAQELLQQQAEALTQANQMKDEFLAIVSHELRTPLNSMLGWAKLLRSRKFDEATTARALETIERNAKSQAQIIDDILEVSRIVRGKIRLNMRPISLVATIEAAIDAVRPTAETKAIQLVEVLPAKSFQVSGDSDCLQQVIWNLLSNAIKFTPEGGRVEVKLEYVEDQSISGVYAQLQVIDTGKGISGEFLPYVFERFRQADSSSTRSYGGLGLGLAIVRQLVEVHGGTVEADSAGEGKGATFTVKLPLLNSPKFESLSAESDTVSEGNTEDLILSGLRVLVVEDDADSREFLITVLQQDGAEVTAVASVSEALRVLESCQLDVLVSDIGMPVEDGYSLIRKVRVLLPQAELPAIALTAYARDEDRQQALLAGFQMHISKPIEPGKLVAMVAKVSGRSS